MPQRVSKALTYKIHGTSNTLDGTNNFSGAMLALINLIPDPSSKDLWQCRPAAVPLVTGIGGGSGGFISTYKIVGSFLYGMAASSSVPGFDAPFCINLTTNALVPVTGTITSTTLPATQSTTGAWIPPQMDIIGTQLMVAHPGFTGTGGNWVGWFDVSTPASPVWHAGNMGGAIAFTIAPIAVKQFGNRAYYIQNSPTKPTVVYSDAFNATNATNATQFLTFNDNVPLTALGALPLNNQLGGVIQAIMVFKNVTNIFQILGDAATNNLSINALNVATGTLAPNSICSTSYGLAFMSPEGIRVIGFDGNVIDPIGNAGEGMTIPFIYSSVSSRVAAACNGTILRITSQNGAANGSPQQEWWYSFSRKVWTGPHTFPASLIAPYQGTFIMTGISTSTANLNGIIFQSDPVQSALSVFTENTVPMTWTAQTVLLPDTEQITNHAMTEATWDFALPPTLAPIAVVAGDQYGQIIDTIAVIPPPATSTTVWGSFTWGSAVWAGGIAATLAPYQLHWHYPIVFSRMTLTANGSSAASFKLGTLRMRYQLLRIYTNTAAAA